MSNRKKLAMIRVVLAELGDLAHRLHERTEELEINLDNAWSVRELKEHVLMIQGAIVAAKLSSLEDPEES